MRLVTPTQVPPMPVPTDVGLALLQSGAESRIVMQIATPTGVSFYFLDADAAEAVGNDLRSLASQARSGIIVPLQGVTP